MCVVCCGLECVPRPVLNYGKFCEGHVMRTAICPDFNLTAVMRQAIYVEIMLICCEFRSCTEVIAEDDDEFEQDVVKEEIDDDGAGVDDVELFGLAALKPLTLSIALFVRVSLATCCSHEYIVHTLKIRKMI